MPVRKKVTFDQRVEGQRVEVDGGAEVIGTGTAARESFAGILTGRRMEYGVPPWRWTEVAVGESDGEGSQTVWCDESFVFVIDSDGGIPQLGS
jgi:hypothetical protein